MSRKIQLATQATARMVFHSGVDGGRSQSGVGLNTNLGMSGDDEADEGGAHCTDREPMDQNDAGSLGDSDMPQRLPPPPQTEGRG